MRSDAVIVSKKAHLFWLCLKGASSHLCSSRARNSFSAFHREDFQQSFMGGGGIKFVISENALKTL